MNILNNHSNLTSSSSLSSSASNEAHLPLGEISATIAYAKERGFLPKCKLPTCFSPFNTIIKYNHESEAIQILGIIAERIASLWANFLTLGGHKNKDTVACKFAKLPRELKFPTAAEMIRFKNVLIDYIMKELAFVDRDKTISAISAALVQPLPKELQQIVISYHLVPLPSVVISWSADHLEYLYTQMCRDGSKDENQQTPLTKNDSDFFPKNAKIQLNHTTEIRKIYLSIS